MFLRRSQCVDNEEVACTERSFPFLLDLNLRTQIFFFFQSRVCYEVLSKHFSSEEQTPSSSGQEERGHRWDLFGRQMLVTNQTP